MSLKAAIAKTIDLAVRAQILAECPEYIEGDHELQREYVYERLNAMDNAEFLGRISDAFNSMFPPTSAVFCDTKPCLPESPCRQEHECYGYTAQRESDGT